MKTIGAKELRLHLDTIFDRVLGGEDIIVQHRFKQPVRLSALQTASSKKQAKLAGLRAFEVAPKRPSPFSPTKPVKQLYHESITAKHAA